MAKQAAKPTEGENLQSETLSPDFVGKVDGVAKDALTKYNVTDAFLADLKTKLKDRKINGTKDVVNYDIVKGGILELKTLRNRVEDKRKELKDPFFRAGQAIDAEAKRITNVIIELEKPLVDEKKRIDEAAEAEKRAEYERRIKALKEAGFMFDGRVWIIGAVMLHAQSLETMELDVFNNFIDSGKQEAERIRLEEEDRKERERQQAARAAELEQKEKDLADREAKLNAQEAGQQAIFPDEPHDEPAQYNTGHEPPREVTPQQYLSGRPQNPAFPPRPKHPEFIAGANQMRNAILRILDSPDKFTREQLKAKINSITLG